MTATPLNKAEGTKCFRTSVERKCVKEVLLQNGPWWGQDTATETSPLPQDLSVLCVVLCPPPLGTVALNARVG